MDSILRLTVVYFFLVSNGFCCSAGSSKSLKSRADIEGRDSVDVILFRLKDRTEKLQSYQCKIEYLFRQPLFESQTLRKGVLYYAKFDDKSALRINFETLKQDNESEEKYIEQYIFDGLWLTHINCQLKQVKRYQQAEPNEPADVFDLARRNFPIIGFSHTDDLKKDFDIKLVGQGVEAEDFVQLHLKVKPDSVYSNDYVSINFWIDKKLNLPTKIVAVSAEDDIYQIMLNEPKVNQKMNKSVFEFDLPEDFTPEIVGLNKHESG